MTGNEAAPGGSHPAGRPLLLVDVDGVLNPYGAPWFAGLQPGDGFAFHEVGPVGPYESLRVALSPEHGRWLTELARVFDLVWATTWRHDANRLLSPLLGLPGDLPVITLRGGLDEHGVSAKAHAIAAWTAGRPFAWIDDEAGEPTARALALIPGVGPHRCLEIDPATGLTRVDVAELEAFAREVGG